MVDRLGADHSLRCRHCDRTYAVRSPPPRCDHCDGRITVTLGEVPALPDDGGPRTLDRYRELLPTAGIDLPESGAGWTPLIAMPALGRHAGVAPDELLVKNETVNPTWSWKDRLAALVVPHAIARGAERIATATTGNHGAAIAAAASRMGIEETLVSLAPEADDPQARRASAVGGTVVRLPAHDESGRLLEQLAEEGWFVAYDLPGRFTGQPYVYAGYATIAYELLEQREAVPDRVIVPVGSGDGLFGIWCGFRRLHEAGHIDRTPRMIGAEAATRQPLTRAIEAGAESVGDHHGAEPRSTSTKGSTSGDHALRAIRESNGTAVAVEDAAMDRAIRTAGQDGIFLEPASALAAAAGVSVLESSGDPGTTVVVGTGSGYGWPDKTAPALPADHEIDPTLSDVAAVTTWSPSSP